MFFFDVDFDADELPAEADFIFFVSLTRVDVFVLAVFTSLDAFFVFAADDADALACFFESLTCDNAGLASLPFATLRTLLASDLPELFNALSVLPIFDAFLLTEEEGFLTFAAEEARTLVVFFAARVRLVAAFVVFLTDEFFFATFVFAAGVFDFFTAAFVLRPPAALDDFVALFFLAVAGFGFFAPDLTVFAVERCVVFFAGGFAFGFAFVFGFAFAFDFTDVPAPARPDFLDVAAVFFFAEADGDAFFDRDAVPLFLVVFRVAIKYTYHLASFTEPLN